MDVRVIFCPSCGGKLKIPAQTRAGRKARCGLCSHTFSVPPMANTVPKRPTSAGMYRLEDLPADLREDMEKMPEVGPAQRQTSPAERRLDTDVAMQRAFDLDDESKPRRRTGARLYKLDDILSVDEPDPG